MYKQSLFAITALAMLSTSSLATSKLNDVVITSKSNKSIQDLAGSITVITKEDIEKINSSNIKDILVRTSGIVESVNSSSSYGRKSISIRGSESKHVLIMVNGQRVNNTDKYIGHSDFQYSWIPTTLIERIEVIKGPKSSIYGSAAIGGVINIITKDLADGESFGEVDIQVGQASGKGGDERKISANGGGKITENLSFVVSANKEKRDVASGTRQEFSWATYSYVNNSNATTFEGIDSKNAYVKLNYDFDDSQSIYATYNTGEEIRELTTNPEYYVIKRKMYDIVYNKDFGGISLDLAYAVADSSSEFDGFSNYSHNLVDTTIRGELELSTIENNYLIVGAETSKEDYKRNYITSGSTLYDYDLTTNAFYIQDEIELGNFILTLGARYDDHENFGSQFSPSVNFVYKLGENHRIKAGYAEGFSAPSVLQGSSAYVNTSYGIQGNDDLSPESSKSFEIGYEYYGKDLTFKTAAYTTDVEDLITTGTSTTGDTSSQYLNIDEGSMKGMEVEVDYFINENHTIKANYNYLKTEDKTTGLELAFKPKHKIDISLESEFSNGWSTYVSANYIGSQIDTSDEKVSGYTQLDFQIQKELSENTTIRLGMDNVTDKSFKDGEPYELRRRFTYVGLNYKF